MSQVASAPQFSYARERECQVFLHHFPLSQFARFQEGGCLCLPLNERDYLRTGNKTKRQERISCYNQTDDDSAPIKEN